MELLLPQDVNVGCIRSAGGPGSLLFLSHQAHDSVSLGLGRGVAQAQAGPFLSPGVDRGPAQQSVRKGLSPVALCPRSVLATPSLVLQVFTEYLLCYGHLLGWGLVMSDGGGPAPLCTQVRAPLLTRSCGGC